MCDAIKVLLPKKGKRSTGIPFENFFFKKEKIQF